MTGFEPRSSGIESDGSVNFATTTAHWSAYFFLKKWANPGFLFLFIFVLFHYNFNNTK